MNIRSCPAILCLAMPAWAALAQPIGDPAVAPGLHRGRVIALSIGGGAAITGSLIALDNAWYDDYERTSFHFFNDGGEWLGMDKVGHAFACYTTAGWGRHLVRWTGASEGASRWIGGSIGLAYLTAVEVMDGYSAGWGFSPWDMVANVSGTALWIAQDALWREQRLKLKFSAHLTAYAEADPELLGGSTAERILKDYNGQTYWLSFNPLGARSDRWPRWLDLSLGYGAEGMISGSPGDDPEAGPAADERRSQFYASLDVDLRRLPVRGKGWRTLLTALNCIKVPAPALEIDSNGNVAGHWIYF